MIHFRVNFTLVDHFNQLEHVALNHELWRRWRKIVDRISELGWYCIFQTNICNDTMELGILYSGYEFYRDFQGEFWKKGILNIWAGYWVVRKDWWRSRSVAADQIQKVPVGIQISMSWSEKIMVRKIFVEHLCLYIVAWNRDCSSAEDYGENFQHRSYPMIQWEVAAREDGYLKRTTPETMLENSYKTVASLDFYMTASHTYVPLDGSVFLSARHQTIFFKRQHLKIFLDYGSTQ